MTEPNTEINNLKAQIAQKDTQINNLKAQIAQKINN